MYRSTKDTTVKSASCPNCGSTRLLLSKGILKCTNCDTPIGKVENNKYGAKKTDYSGVKYHSRFEAECAEILDTRLRAKDIKKVERQVKIDLRAYDEHMTNYFIDFVITHNDGHREYIEAKGAETDLWKLKFKMLEAKLKNEEPDAELTLWKQRSYKKVR
jgi:hypothetical protein